MRRLLIAALAIAALPSASIAGSGKTTGAAPIFNRQPLAETRYAALPIGAIKPDGWLRTSMQTMLDGMTGHLDEIYSLVVGDDNAWLGGEGDAWERGPYWIDGALPMAYIMEDEALKAKVNRWVESILASQKPNGYFGPDTDRPDIPGMQRRPAADWWPRMVALKILQQYYMATADSRVPEFMSRYFRYQLAQLPTSPLGKWTYWATERGGDNLLMVYWLYNITGEEWLLELGELLHSQTADWTARFTATDHLMRQNSLHCVNLAHGLKEPVVYWQASHRDEHLAAPQQALSRIRTTFGFPTGLWAGDELTHFGEPTRGSELCTTVEMMYSLEEMQRITGSTAYSDLLERVAYNALPTQITPHADARQYYHQINQVEVRRAVHNFSTMHENTDLVYGQLTGYPCCTCNLHQGWPKLTQNLWYATSDGGFAAMVYAPCTLHTTLASGTRLTITERTCYPFEEKIEFAMQLSGGKRRSAEFPLEFRIPAWSTGMTVSLNGNILDNGDIQIEEGHAAIRRTWNDGDTLSVEFAARVRISYWWDNAAVVEHGALIYALKMDEKWCKYPLEGNDSKYGRYYYEVTSDTPWNVALYAADLKEGSIENSFELHRTECSDKPWSVAAAPLQISARARMLPTWGISRNSAAAINYRPQQNAAEVAPEQVDITLVPFGCTVLRIAEFPVR